MSSTRELEFARIGSAGSGPFNTETSCISQPTATHRRASQPPIGWLGCNISIFSERRPREFHLGFVLASAKFLRDLPMSAAATPGGRPQRSLRSLAPPLAATLKKRVCPRAGYRSARENWYSEWLHWLRLCSPFSQNKPRSQIARLTPPPRGGRNAHFVLLLLRRRLSICKSNRSENRRPREFSAISP